MFCKKCGSEFPNHSNFCPQCGEMIQNNPKTKNNLYDIRNEIKNNKSLLLLSLIASILQLLLIICRSNIFVTEKELINEYIAFFNLLPQILFIYSLKEKSIPLSLLLLAPPFIIDFYKVSQNFINPLIYLPIKYIVRIGTCVALIYLFAKLTSKFNNMTFSICIQLLILVINRYIVNVVENTMFISMKKNAFGVEYNILALFLGYLDTFLYMLVPTAEMILAIILVSFFFNRSKNKQEHEPLIRTI